MSGPAVNADQRFPLIATGTPGEPACRRAIRVAITTRPHDLVVSLNTTRIGYTSTV
jgi:hypothetical protein